MSRGESYGGGQSSLNYLFGSGDKQQDKQQDTPPPPSPTIYAPPYGIDTTPEKPPKTSRPPTFPPPKEQNASTNYHRADGQNSGNFITDRPSTKVKSVPGGDSSLGYLFGKE